MQGAAFGHKMRSVALRKESVDRNNDTNTQKKNQPGSLSARRAWIEMIIMLYDSSALMSLSARRAWIEMPDSTHRRGLFQRRSPQGERG